MIGHKPGQELSGSTLLGLHIGNTIEYYDYIIFGLLTPVISRLFFPADNRIASLMMTFAAFAAGMIMRPLGGLLIGWIGDSRGRRAALMFSSLATGLATFVIGCLPDVASVGLLATVLLVVMRLVQGVGMSTEMCSVMIITGEYGSRSNKGFRTSATHGSAMFGTLVASLIITAVYLLPEPELYAWGWRIPFWVGGLVCINAWILRRNLETLPMQKTSVTQWLGNLRGEWQGLLSMLLLVAVNTLVYHIAFVFHSTRMIELLDLPANTVMLINSCNLIILILMVLVGGLFSDAVGQYRAYLLSLGSIIVFSPFLTMLLNTPAITASALGQTGFAVLGGLLLGSSSTLYSELTDYSVRVTGTALPYNFAIVIFGGTAPLMVMTLQHMFGTPWADGLYISLVAVTALLVVYKMATLAQYACNSSTGIASGCSE